MTDYATERSLKSASRGVSKTSPVLKLQLRSAAQSNSPTFPVDLQPNAFVDTRSAAAIRLGVFSNASRNSYFERGPIMLVEACFAATVDETSSSESQSRDPPEFITDIDCMQRGGASPIRRFAIFGIGCVLMLAAGNGVAQENPLVPDVQSSAPGLPRNLRAPDGNKPAPARRRRPAKRRNPAAQNKAAAQERNQPAASPETADVRAIRPDRRSYWMRSNPLDPVKFKQLQFSPDGQTLAALTEDKVAEDKLLGQPAIRPTAVPTMFKVTEDDLLGQPATMRTPVLMWEAETGRRLPEASRGVPFFDIAFNADGTGLFGVAHPKGLRHFGAGGRLACAYWRVNGEPAYLELLVKKGEEYETRNIVQSPDKKQIIAAGLSGLKIWEVPPEFGERSRPITAPLPREIASTHRWLGPAGFSADAANCVAWTSDSALEVWDIAAGKMRCAIKDGRFAGLRPHAVRIVKGPLIVALFIKNSKQESELEGSSLGIVADGQTGNVLHVFRAAKGDMICLDCEPDGKFAVTGGSDGVARIWSVPTAQHVAAFAIAEGMVHRVALSHDRRMLAAATALGVRMLDISKLTGAAQEHREPLKEVWLAHGPLDVTIRTRSREFEAKLLKLTGTELVCRLPAKDKLFEVDLTGGVVQKIEAHGGKASWVWNEGKKSLEGDPLKDLPAAISGAQLTHDQEELYLLLRLERMLHRAIAPGQSAKRDDVLFEAFRNEASALEKHVVDNHFAEAIAPFPKMFIDLAGKAQLESAEQSKIVCAQEIQLKKLAKAQEKAQDRAVLTRITGVAAAIGGTLSDSKWVEVPGTRTPVYVEDPLQPFYDDLRDAGLTTLLRSYQDAELRSNYLENVGKHVDEDSRNKLAASAKRQSAVIDEALKRVEAAIAARLGGEAPIPLVPSTNDAKGQSRADSGAIADQLARRGEQIRRHMGSADPFIEAHLIVLRRPPGDAAKPDELRADAQKLAQLAALVPEGAIYDRDRADLLCLAGQTALDAAIIETGAQSWATAYNAAAGLAVRYFDEALDYDPEDADGAIRESRAWALFLTGRLADAMRQVVDVEDLRFYLPIFHVRSARLKAALGWDDEAAASLRIAVERLWYSDIEKLKKCPELKLRTNELNDLLALRLEIRPSDLFVNPPRVTIINRSAFPVQDLDIRLRYVVDSLEKKSNTVKVAVPMILPDDEYRFDLDAKLRPKRDASGAVSDFNVTLLGSRQGPGQIEVVQYPRPGGQPRGQPGGTVKSQAEKRR